MPNPYKYTNSELGEITEQWHDDDTITVSLKEYIMYLTRFSDYEFERWARTGVVPYGSTETLS